MRNNRHNIILNSIRSGAVILFLSFFAAALTPTHCIAAEFDLSRDNIKILIETSPDTIDPARDFFLSITIATPHGVKAAIPDLRDRFSGFSVAEDFAEPSSTPSDGGTVSVIRWRLVPKPAAPRYRLAPFAVTKTEANGTVSTFPTSPIIFAAPDAPKPVTGDFEVDPKPDRKPLTFTNIAICLCAIALIVLFIFLIRRIRRSGHERRLSPIERAFAELDRLLGKHLPSRGLYKDFYIELTMVVRRYIERAHGVRAPKLTTEEFLRDVEKSSAFSSASVSELRAFLESSDLVKFAGIKATPEMAAGATDKAKNYLEADKAKGGPE